MDLVYGDFTDLLGISRKVLWKKMKAFRIVS
jgi:transcriptional regulator of acetoin/glycerol metabolism